MLDNSLDKLVNNPLIFIDTILAYKSIYLYILGTTVITIYHYESASIPPTISICT